MIRGWPQFPVILDICITHPLLFPKIPPKSHLGLIFRLGTALCWSHEAPSESPVLWGHGGGIKLGKNPGEWIPPRGWESRDGNEQGGEGARARKSLGETGSTQRLEDTWKTLRGEGRGAGASNPIPAAFPAQGCSCLRDTEGRSVSWGWSGLIPPFPGILIPPIFPCWIWNPFPLWIHSRMSSKEI